ncbi:class I SAM-dependent methyltransferase [Actinomyces capricornis]|nr:class I SAM-dependent methyltransferase [Actinomyces capricornis]
MTPSTAEHPGPTTESQFSHPSSLVGRLLLRGMNHGHRHLHTWGLQAAGIRDADRVLDIGCGGGKAISRILRLTRREVAGVDHSPDAVATTLRVNRAAARSGRLRAVEGSAQAIPFPDAFFDVVTAFETIYFWPDLPAGLAEIHRVLRPGGRLLIANEFADRRMAGSWAQRLGMTVPDGEELADLVQAAGFTQVEADHHPRRGWLHVLATKA